ncbi:MAG: hypothetical protein Q9222_007393 [Ikaeria aurantiellina]
MAAAATDERGNVLSLKYTDSYGEQQYILELEGLCSRAGCVCINNRVRCTDVRNPFFELAIYNHYHIYCASRCSCTQIAEARIFDRAQDPVLAGEPQAFKIGNMELMGEVGRPHNTVNRNNPTGSALGGAACLKGEAAGWTLWNWRRTKCCPDTDFKPLTAQEAYSIYGVAPFSSDIITNTVTIGVCLPR